jgi:AcrR family transcriptional regulator
MARPNRRVDRRIQRTRQVLQRAFMDVVQDKGFAATSIQDIAQRANVNRGTFYLHFADKYMLTDAVIREQFQQHLADRLPAAPHWDWQSLRLLIEAVLDCLEGKYRHQQRPSPMLAEVGPLLERAMHEELSNILLVWLQQGRHSDSQLLVPLEQIASVVSWAIFGPALQWSRAPGTITSEQMVHTIALVVMEGVAHLGAEVGLA